LKVMGFQDLTKDSYLKCTLEITKHKNEQNCLHELHEIVSELPLWVSLGFKWLYQIQFIYYASSQSQILKVKNPINVLNYF
jgi:hypothetical protein